MARDYATMQVWVKELAGEIVTRTKSDNFRDEDEDDRYKMVFLYMWERNRYEIDVG